MQPACGQIYLFHLTPPCRRYLVLPEIAAGIRFSQGKFPSGQLFLYLPISQGGWMHLKFKSESSSYRLCLSCCGHQPWLQSVCPRISSLCAFLAPVNVTLMMAEGIQQCSSLGLKIVKKRMLPIMSISLLYMPLTNLCLFWLNEISAKSSPHPHPTQLCASHSD